MSRLDQLLETRVFWMERFLAVSNALLLSLPEHAQVHELDLFEHNRISLLKNIEATDKKIAAFFTENFSDQSQIPAQIREKFYFYNQKKNRILRDIEMADEAILEQMSSAHKNIAKKLAVLKKGRTALSKYKNHGTFSETLDKKL